MGGGLGILVTKFGDRAMLSVGQVVFLRFLQNGRYFRSRDLWPQSECTTYEAWVSGSSDQVWSKSAGAFGTSSDFSDIGKKEEELDIAVVGDHGP